MNNPWLGIPLADYEGHMSLPDIGQAKMLADLFESLLREFLPRSVAVIGCAGGNGFERLVPGVTTRVVGVDINPTYIEACRERYSGQVAGLELHAGDIQSDKLVFRPVALIYAALVFEYLNPAVTLAKLAALLQPGGILVALVQLESPQAEAVTPSKYSTLQQLSPLMRLIPPEELVATALSAGLVPTSSRRIASPSGKAFELMLCHLPLEQRQDSAV